MEEWGHEILRFAPAFFRTLGFLVMLPFGEGLFMHSVRLSMALVLSLTMPLDIVHFSLWQAAGNLVVGMILALPVAVIIHMAEWWGELYDSGRGQHLAVFYTGASMSSSSVMGLLVRQRVFVGYLLSGGLSAGLLSVSASFNTVIPKGIDLNFSSETALMVLSFVTDVACATVLLILPVAILYLLMDIAVAVIAIFVPRLVSFSGAYQLKTILSLVALISLIDFDLFSSLKAATDVTLLSSP
ncbi:MAG: hypothetical protein D6719_11025 [Candidatus Dadabacteria bacterium]|nr:MAG: hypothetical protein D6719_11025 [Candidatus Dadabacteria bacterium]